MQTVVRVLVAWSALSMVVGPIVGTLLSGGTAPARVRVDVDRQRVSARVA